METPAAPPVKTPAAPPADPSPDAVSPPRVLESVDAVYPAEALAEGRQATVELLVTVLVEGTVGEVVVATTGGRPSTRRPSTP